MLFVLFAHYCLLIIFCSLFFAHYCGHSLQNCANDCGDYGAIGLLCNPALQIRAISVLIYPRGRVTARSGLLRDRVLYFVDIFYVICIVCSLFFAHYCVHSLQNCANDCGITARSGFIFCYLYFLFSM